MSSKKPWPKNNKRVKYKRDHYSYADLRKSASNDEPIAEWLPWVIIAVPVIAIIIYYVLTHMS